MSNESGAPKRKRHSWGESVQHLYKTECECRDCGLVRVTRHERPWPWQEFWRGGDKVAGTGMPSCEPALKLPAVA